MSIAERLPKYAVTAILVAGLGALTAAGQTQRHVATTHDECDGATAISGRRHR